MPSTTASMIAVRSGRFERTTGKCGGFCLHSLTNDFVSSLVKRLQRDWSSRRIRRTRRFSRAYKDDREER